jgi:hypothetical protein
MSNKVILPHKASKEDITVYYNPSIKMWTPYPGEPVILEVYGNMSVRAGQNRWVTDLIDIPEGQLRFMKQKELRSLVNSIKTVLGDTFPETKIHEIVQDVVSYSR